MVDGLSTPGATGSASATVPQGWHALSNAKGVAGVRKHLRLLISVRNADEATAALAGGADIIDIKEPLRGPLGMADVSTIADILARVAGRAPVSAALGEVTDWLNTMGATGSASADRGTTGSASAFPTFPPGLSFAKLGLAGQAGNHEWIDDWIDVRSAIDAASGHPLPWVAVAYADAEAAAAPPVAEVIHAAARTGCIGVLIDTCDKSSGSVLRLRTSQELRAWRELAQANGLLFALAGKLCEHDLQRAAVQSADVVGVRSAACTAGDRQQPIAAEQVAALRRRLRARRTRTAHRARQAARRIRAAWPCRPVAGLILGTGMSGLLNLIDVDQSLDTRDLPYFHPTTAPGHRGRVVCGRLHGVPVIALDGRIHRYEGHSLARIQFPIHVLHQLGAQVLIATNAAGGLNPAYEIGDVMVLDNHIDLMSGAGLSLIVERLSKNRSGATGSASASTPGGTPRPTGWAWQSTQHAPDTTEPLYNSDLAASAIHAAAHSGFTAHRGTYIGVTGPNYETRAEYRLFRSIGGDAVGMSTIPEVRAAAALGMQTLALSVITNVANPDALEPADAASVIHAAERTQTKVQVMLEAVIHSLALQRSTLNAQSSTLPSTQHKTQ